MPASIQELTERKEKLKNKLQLHGITKYPIDFLPYLDYEDSVFASPQEVGKRMMLLYAVSHTVHNLNERKKIAKWLKKEGLWEDVSETEKLFFERGVSEQKELVKLSWQFESAYILAWAAGLVKECPPATGPATPSQMDEFVNNLPTLGSKLGNFFTNLTFIDKTEIYIENLFNELATSYFRDLLFSGEENKSDIHKAASFQRHFALNWLRRFSDIKEWENTDTST